MRPIKHALWKQKTKLPEVLAQCALKDTLNLDKSALFYHEIPTGTLVSTKRAGIEGRAKVRLSFNAIFNARTFPFKF